MLTSSQPRFQCAVEFAIRGGQGVGQLLDAACAKNDRSNGRIPHRFHIRKEALPLANMRSNGELGN